MIENQRWIPYSVGVLLCALLTLLSPALSEERKFYGRYERVIIPDIGKEIELRAKLDSGAYTSSLHAVDIEHYQKPNGEHWVRFKTRGKRKKDLITVERPLLRMAQIKQRIEEDEEEEESEFPFGNVELTIRHDEGEVVNHYFEAQDVETFRRAGDRWVRFYVPTQKGKPRRVEIPILNDRKSDKALAKEQQEAAEAARLAERPVIKIALCLGDRIEEVEVNLTDRSNFTYPLLVGAKSLRQFGAIIDADSRYQHPPLCFLSEE